MAQGATTESRIQITYCVPPSSSLAFQLPAARAPRLQRRATVDINKDCEMTAVTGCDSGVWVTQWPWSCDSQVDGHCVTHTPLQRLVASDWRLCNANLPCILRLSWPLGPGRPAWASWDASRALRRPVDAVPTYKFKSTKLAVEPHPQPMA